MKLSETTEIVETIYYYYQNWLKPGVDLEKLIRTWHQTLSNYEFEPVKERVLNHVTKSNFAPTVAELVGKKDPRDGTPHPDGGVWYHGEQVY